MVWCCQAANHYLGQCWPRYMEPYGNSRQQYIKPLIARPASKINAQFHSNGKWIHTKIVNKSSRPVFFFLKMFPGLSLKLSLQKHPHPNYFLPKLVILHIEQVTSSISHRTCTWFNTLTPETKWTTFRRRRFQTYFYQRKCLNFD